MTKQFTPPPFQGEILTARPPGMNFTAYREHLIDQKRRIEKRTRHGFLEYLAAELINVHSDGRKIPASLEEGAETPLHQHIRTYPPFVRKRQ